MSETVHTPIVGQLVYASYNPKRAGKITAVLSPRIITVKWLDGNETQTDTIGLKDLISLRDACQKKANTHNETIWRLRKL